ncbi:hypothetical protein [Streptomyces endophytica]|uniref:Uncharacterized protein n=1 Tax=Streptomyces endophytica TaxID=2991496 RepID=A0ABY6PGM8_9ACTN|nr:hypothetical protein [Streptomyces endophytica]UZJ33039.1 hypothetical protein OJ254_25545 [Streptomyces endophytica]
MSEEHRSAEDPARAAPGDEERRLARKALAGRARDAADLSLLMDMLDLDPGRDPGRGTAHAPAADHGRGPGRGARAGRARSLLRPDRGDTP